MKRILLAMMLVLLGGAAFGQQPKGTTPANAPNVPGGKVVLVNRDKMRAPPGTKSFRIPQGIREAEPVPIPKSFDWSMSHTIEYPMDGNDTEGDCFLADQLKKIYTYSMQVNKKKTTFARADIIKRYYQLTGGQDVGLSNEDIFPAFEGGLLPVNGPWKILDWMSINPTDKKSVDTALYLFGPVSYTFTVHSSFMNDAKSGAIIDRNSGGIDGGHAMCATGRTEAGHLNTQTWGFKEGVYLTDHFVGVSDSEVLAVFSKHWFNEKGYAPNGQHYQTLAKLWNAMGGKVDPIGGFPPPDGPPPPPPPPPPPAPGKKIELVVDGKVVYTLVADAPTPKTLSDLYPNLTPEQLAFILELIKLFGGKSEPTPAPQAKAMTVADQLTAELNAVRAKYGLPPMVNNPSLNTTCQNAAGFVSRLRRLMHGSGEHVLAMGQRSVREVIADWIASPGHRAWLLSNNASCGWGVATDASGQMYWAGAFGGALSVTEKTTTLNSQTTETTVQGCVTDANGRTTCSGNSSSGQYYQETQRVGPIRRIFGR